VVDSTADIPAERAREFGITVVPLMVLFGDDAFRDGIDLDSAAFYSKLTASPVTPTTSAPAPGLFEDAYHTLIKQGATGILVLSIASQLSATFAVAQRAAELVSKETGVPIEVVDSGTVSQGFGLPAEILAREARDGASLDTLKARAESLVRRVRLYASLDTLEFLQRGGRIGRARAMLGTLLSVKPLLEVRNGHVLPLEQVRTRGKALDRMAQLVAGLGQVEGVAVVGSDPASRDMLTNVVRGVWSGPIEESFLGPVVGTHAGPGAVGVVAITAE
jgi:DegV family protein with EDD domain